MSQLVTVTSICFVRRLQTGLLQRAFSDAATAGRGGLVRDVLTAQYPRLAQLLEDTMTKVLQDTEVGNVDCSSSAAMPHKRNCHLSRFFHVSLLFDGLCPISFATSWLAKQSRKALGVGVISIAPSLSG